MDNFDLVLLNKLTLLSILWSFVHINVLKLLWRNFFKKHFLIAKVITINFAVLFLQKQPLEVLCKKRCS